MVYRCHTYCATPSWISGCRQSEHCPSFFPSLGVSTEPALVCIAAVLIDEPADPHPALRPRGHLREDDGVLDDDPLLIAVAVRHPVLQLLAGQLPAVHPLVKGVPVVIPG